VFIQCVNSLNIVKKSLDKAYWNLLPFVIDNR